MHSVVVLNRNYEYWTEVGDIKKVIKWILKEKIEVVISNEEEEYGSIEFKIKMPVVVRLLHFVGFKIKSDSVPYSDSAVYYRDNSQCQYWHHDKKGRRYIYQCTEEDRTIDHVVPKSKGGGTSFENCVTACRNCNERVKKNKLPREAGLELIRPPRKPVNRKGEYAYFKFTFNPHKPSHVVYMERFLKRKFSNVVR